VKIKKREGGGGKIAPIIRAIPEKFQSTRSRCPVPLGGDEWRKESRKSRDSPLSRDLVPFRGELRSCRMKQQLEIKETS
jgi:hypothetical protein